MGGISKHYILHSKDDAKFFDKKAITVLDRFVTTKVTNSNLTTAAAEFLAKRDAILSQTTVPWRKKLLDMWTLCKLLTKSKYPWSLRLSEYQVRKGRGIHRMDSFKKLSMHYRGFRIPPQPKKKTIKLNIPQRFVVETGRATTNYNPRTPHPEPIRPVLAYEDPFVTEETPWDTPPTQTVTTRYAYPLADPMWGPGMAIPVPDTPQQEIRMTPQQYITMTGRAAPTPWTTPNPFGRTRG